MRKYLLIFIICVFVYLPGRCQAEAKLEDRSVKTLDMVVVTGSRAEQEIEKIPANVTVIDKSDIKDSNAKNIVEILRYEEGINVRDKLGNGKTSEVDLRGFGETASYNTLVLVDGRRVNEIDLSGTDWTQIPIEQVERIEVLRGTGSVLYGDNAVGGVINIITRTPSEELMASVEADTGSFGRNREWISASGGRDRITAAVFAGYDSIEGYRDENGFMAKDIGGRIDLDPSDFLILNFSGSYHKDEFDLPGPLTEAQYIADREMNANPLDEGESEDYYFKAGLDLDLFGYGNVIADLAYRKRDNKAVFPDPSGVFPQGTRSVTETWSLSPRYIMERNIFNHENRLIAGIDLYWAEQEMDSFGGFFIPLITRTGFANTDRDSLGVYFNNEFSLMDNIVLSTGVRHERVEYSFNQEDLTLLLTPLNTKVKKRENAYSLGISYLYDQSSSLFFRVNQSIRFPLTDEVSYVDWVTFVIMANTDLQPQKGRHYECGIKHYLTPDIRGTFTLFRAEIDNEIFYNPMTFSNENHPKTLRHGVEAGISGEIFRRVNLFVNYSYVEAEFDENPYKGNDIPSVPRHRANLGFRINNILPGLAFSADYSYFGARYAISDHANNFEKIDNHYSINGKLSYGWKSFSAFFGLNNITNQEYSEYEVMDTFLTARNFYPAPERTWTAGLEIRF
ncbi:MAG: TonB-dependent receptor [Deltaproteobacteria bacterium]|nr:TonB-dependent receptor [Deltaproteobacteria bacterium]